MSTKGHHDVVVVGAGLAGLNAALKLEAEGCDVLVLEAQERVGGRIHSMRHLGSNAEAGGTYIGAGYTRIIDAARQFDVRLIDVTPMLEFFREQDLVLGSEIIRQSEWAEHELNPFPERDRALLPWQYHRVLAMRENPLDSPHCWIEPEYADADVSVHEWMKSLGLSDRAIEIAYGINPSFGADAHDISALLLFFRAAFSKAQRRFAPEGSVGYTAEGGVQRLPEAMAAGLRREVALGSTVVGIESGDYDARVYLANGGTVTASAVVCALPFSVLRGLAIDPPLRGPQAQAVRSLRVQPITQVYMRPKSAFWLEDGYSASLYTDSAAGMVAAVRNGEDPNQVTTMTAWLMGPNAARADAMSEQDAGREVVAAIERIRPAAKGQLELIGLKSWGRDPYALGAWTYFRPGEVRAFAAHMGQRHERIHFCGEHLARSNRGMEGAMETGERAADEILAER
ncbi:MAG: FAD-dependent oxidoreductase [Gammaproteobacteria bacterium]|nr:FAD-dependent oxidoreductase [Gammaproteobacteria bacterium]